MALCVWDKAYVFTTPACLEAIRFGSCYWIELVSSVLYTTFLGVTGEMKGLARKSVLRLMKHSAKFRVSPILSIAKSKSVLANLLFLAKGNKRTTTNSKTHDVLRCDCGLECRTCRDSNLVDSASSIRLSQRLSHACLSINKSILWNCEWLIISVIVYLMVFATWITVVILELIHA